MKKYSYLIIIVLISGLILAGCSLLSNVGQVPTSDQSGITYLTKNPGPLDLVGLWHFDENTGTTAIDSSGNGNNGTLELGMLGNTDPAFAWVEDKWGGHALSFDGSDDYVEIDSFSSTSQSHCVSAWLKSDQFNEDRDYVIDFGGNIFIAWQTNTAGKIGWYDGSWKSVGATPSDGNWHHVVWSLDHSTNIGYVYIDGVELGSATYFPRTISSGNNNIGAERDLFDGRFFSGTIDEVHIWDTAHPSYTIKANPETFVNPVMTSHTITAIISPTTPGVTVHFDIISGPNSGSSSSRSTNSIGAATEAYTGSGGGGTDTIRVWIDLDYSGDFNASYDAYDEVTKDWAVNFVTGGGNIKAGKKTAWNFAGTVGYLPDMTLVGQFQIVDHTSKITYHCNNDFSYLVFSGDIAESPMASYNTASFTGTFTNNRDATTADITVIIQDLGEPGAGTDKISVTGPIALSTTPIDGGNFQVHEGYKSP